eukprot:SM000088S23773  [mRNA]  locus=s88:438286:439293:- [translate_table: standard]
MQKTNLAEVGGSRGCIAIWDQRYLQQPLVLSGAVAGAPVDAPMLSQAEVWQVQFDQLSHYASASVGVAQLPPVVACFEDGLLAAVGRGEELELLRERCAINAFDVGGDFGQDIICALEQEYLVYLSRPRYGDT